MKKLILASVIGLLSTSAFSEVISLSEQGLTGRKCPGTEISYNMPNGATYVERMLISAEGIRNDGFIKVYADNELVFNVGIPGYDPDYSFRIRRPVSNITLKFERTCARVHEAKIFAPNSAPAGYRAYVPQGSNDFNWGTELLEMVRSLSVDLRYDPDFLNKLWPNVLMPLKKIALLQSVSDDVRDDRSLITALRSLQMAKLINDNQAFLDSLLFSGSFDYLIKDMLSIKEDILERYDVKLKDLEDEIAELEAELE